MNKIKNTTKSYCKSKVSKRAKKMKELILSVLHLSKVICDVVLNDSEYDKMMVEGAFYLLNVIVCYAFKILDEN